MAIVNDRIPTQPNRKKITNESTGTVEYATVEYADNPTVVGTPINKALFDKVQFWEKTEGEPKYKNLYMGYIPFPNALNCLFATSKNTLIGVDGNIVYRSIDNGTSWTEDTLPSRVSSSTRWTRYSLAEHDGIIVGVGTSGNVIYSNDDGVTWTRTTVGTSDDLFSLCYYDGVWIAGSEYGAYYVSNDYLQWEKRDTPASGNMYIFAGETGVLANSSGESYVYFSSDLNSWTKSNTNTSNTVTPQVSYGKGIWVVSGSTGSGTSSSPYIYRAAKSTDGINWQTTNLESVPDEHSSGNVTTCQSFDGETFFIGTSKNSMYTSADGSEWTKLTGNPIVKDKFLFKYTTLVAESSNRTFYYRPGENNRLFYFATQSPTLLVCDNDENIMGQECVMSAGDFVGTGTPQYIYLGFPPKFISLSNSSGKSTTYTFPISYNDDVFFEKDGFTVYDSMLIIANKHLYYIAIG